MELRWKESRMDRGRTDLDLMKGQSLLGYFRDYKRVHLKWVYAYLGSTREEHDMSHTTLEEAKAVVEALIRLEG